MNIQPDANYMIWLQSMFQHGFLGEMLQWGRSSSLFRYCTMYIVPIVIHLTFFIGFLFTFVWRRIAQLSRKRRWGEERAEFYKETIRNKNDASVCPHLTARVSFIFKASFSCCILLLSCHFVALMCDILLGTQAQCASTAPVLTKDIVLTLSWAFMSVIAFNFSRSKLKRLPILLRYWWTCAFVESIISLVYDINAQTRRGISSPRFLLDCFSVLFCFVLLCVALKGDTGICASLSELEKPFLEESAEEKQKYAKRSSAYGNSNLLGLVTFSWLNPLFTIGVKKPLELDDVPDVAKKESAEQLYHSFEEKVNTLRLKYSYRTPSITKAVIMFIWKKAALNAMFAAINAFASYVGPYLINYFVEFLTTKEHHNNHQGYILAFAFLGAKVIETVAQRQWIFGARQLCLRLRAALIAHLYRKGLHLSNQARQSHTSGEIINYMSVDVQRIGDFAWYLNTICMLPIQILLAISILYRSLGSASLVALAATFVVMSINLPLQRKQKYFQTKIMESKDKRMKTTSEILKCMKILKLQRWETKYLQRLEDLRNVEYSWLKKFLTVQVTTIFIFLGAPTIISAITFAACIAMGIPLSTGSVLSALATFRILQEPIYSLPELLSVLAQAKVSLDRVTAYLQEEELRSDAVEYVPSQLTNYAIEVKGGEFSWEPSSTEITIKDLNLQLKKGMRVAVCGTVGSGKSSLLSCLLGEIPKVHGSVKVSGTKAYIPQSPWIQTGTIRENILFGCEMDMTKYERVLEACALDKDLELFPHGDQTEIGERGINMSGGQKQRIQIARAVYQDADIYIMDDPFSAVDAHTGTHLFRECLMEVLHGKTIIYVTHQVEFLPSADLILVMKDGMVKQAGKYDELLQVGTGFETLVAAHNQALQTISTIENLAAEGAVKESIRDASVGYKPNKFNHRVKTLHMQNSGKQVCSGIQQDPNADSKYKQLQLVQEEERGKGSIDMKVYWFYLTAIYGGALVPIILLAESAFQVLQIGSNYWMAWACPPTLDAEPLVSTKVLILVYTILSVISSFCVLFRTLLVAIVGLLSSQKLFLDMLRSIFRAPMSFFDTTPTGRILNRASTDQSTVDLEIAFRLNWVAISVIQLIGTVAVMSQVAWQVFVIFIPVTGICIWYQQYYIPTARELARLVGIQSSPILHHFAETLAGVATVRAFDQEGRFVEKNLNLINDHSRPWFHNISALEWLCFRINILSNFVFAFSLIVVVSLLKGVIDPVFAGLAVTFGLNLNVLQATIIWKLCSAETKMISVERIIQYSTIPSEPPLFIENCRPSQNWPPTGTIHLDNLQIRYGKHLPLVLKNLTCTFPGKQKVGVVGRTGSGKSTLIQALFRVVDPADGKILIDGIDICTIGLHDLRSRLSIVPQEPVMFEGTLRANFDPLEEYSDFEIWQAVEKCQLGDIVEGKEEKLNTSVIENGENWSVGQRQLVCLGRALLKRSRILVLDEATASVDTTTDGVIQRMIRSEFTECTVITVAHRIHSVIDSDLVLLLGEGKIVEYDTPSKLLENNKSSFSKLIQEYSMRSGGISISN